MLQQGLSSQHRFGGERLSQHLARGLETRAHNQRHRLRAPVLVLGTEPRGSAEPRGGQRASSQPPTLRAKCSKDNERGYPQWCLFRAVSKMILTKKKTKKTVNSLLKII